MAKRKIKSVDLVKARVRVAPKRTPKAKHAPASKRAAKTTAPTKRTAAKQPPKKLFDAMKWCGILPELAGNSLAIQRRMRDEW